MLSFLLNLRMKWDTNIILNLSCPSPVPAELQPNCSFWLLHMVAWNLFLSSVTFYLGPNQTLVVLNWEVWLEIIYKSNVIWYFICSFISSLVISQVYSRASCLTKRPEVDTRTFLVLSWCCLTPQTIPIVSWKAQWMTLLQGPDWANRGNYHSLI